MGGFGAFGMLGDIQIAGWPAGTYLHYHNGPLYHNSFSGYSDSSIQAAYAASGLFIPTTVTVATSPAGFLGLEGNNIDIWGTLAANVNQADVQRVIEGLMPNFFVKNPATAVYDPPATISQTVDNSGRVIQAGPSTLPVVSGLPVPAFFNAIVVDSVSDPQEGNVWYFQDGSLFLQYPDGTVDLQDGDANSYSGNVSPDGSTIQYDNGMIVVFTPATHSQQVTNPASNIVRTVNQQPGPGSPQPKPPTTGYDWGKLLANFGMANLPVALGVSAGTIVLGGAVLIYLWFTGGGRRR